jgi:hypothetical protein
VALPRAPYKTQRGRHRDEGNKKDGNGKGIHSAVTIRLIRRSLPSVSVYYVL